MRVSESPLEGEAFAKVQLAGCTDVADMVASACDKFPSWGVDATQVHFFLAAAGGTDRPLPAAIAAAAADSAGLLSEEWSLARAGIAPGCWLLARVPPPAVASGAFPFFSRRRVSFARGAALTPTCTHTHHPVSLLTPP